MIAPTRPASVAVATPPAASVETLRDFESRAQTAGDAANYSCEMLSDIPTPDWRATLPAIDAGIAQATKALALTGIPEDAVLLVRSGLSNLVRAQGLLTAEAAATVHDPEAIHIDEVPLISALMSFNHAGDVIEAAIAAAAAAH